MNNSTLLFRPSTGAPTSRCLPRSRGWLVAALLLSPLAGCNTVEFYERGRLADPMMSFDDGAAEAHFHQKVHYSMEGSAGGIGTSAGGGCGCY